jgi:hypothetical protein
MPTNAQQTGMVPLRTEQSSLVSRVVAGPGESRPKDLPCRIPATNRETLARFSPQTAKPETFAAKYA